MWLATLSTPFASLTPLEDFLKKDGDIWVEIGNRKARKNTSQALREGAP